MTPPACSPPPTVTSSHPGTTPASPPPTTRTGSPELAVLRDGASDRNDGEPCRRRTIQRGGAEDAPVHGPVGVDLFCEFGTEEVPGDGSS